VFRVIYEALNTETDENAVYGRSQAYFDGLDETARTSLGWTRGTLNDVIASRLTPWWRYFLRFDPAVYLTQTTCSVLAVNGDHDLNVTASENLAGIDQTLRRAGNTDVTCREFAGLNHMLNRSPVALPGDSLGRGETINSEVLDLVGNWIQRRTGLADPGTAVADHGAALPEELTLAQNYPNPFNPSTTIHYQLDRAGWVTLTVYDPAGQRVTELAAGNQPAGSFSVSWDGHNEAGQPVASGLYLYELRVGEHRSMRKMLLMK